MPNASGFEATNEKATQLTEIRGSKVKQSTLYRDSCAALGKSSSRNCCAETIAAVRLTGWLCKGRGNRVPARSKRKKK